jgi:hypothetical protein
VTPTPSLGIGIGTWPDWIAAIGTWFAFGGLVIGFWWEVRRRRLDEAQLAVERRNARMQQARLIFVEKTSTTTTAIGIKVHNESDAPIFSFGVTCFAGMPGSALRPLRATPRRGNRTGVKAHNVTEVFLDLEGGEPELQSGMLVGIQIDFTDAHGSRWRRVDDGQPQLID